MQFFQLLSTFPLSNSSVSEDIFVSCFCRISSTVGVKERVIPVHTVKKKRWILLLVLFLYHPNLKNTEEIKIWKSHQGKPRTTFFAWSTTLHTSGKTEKSKLYRGLAEIICRVIWQYTRKQQTVDDIDITWMRKTNS